MDMIVKLFSIIMGIVVLVSMVGVISNISAPQCVPSELYHDNSIQGFGGGFFDNIYDGMCSTMINANNAVWNLYETVLAGATGQRGNIATVGFDLWGLASFFCRTYSNFEYYSENDAAAITETETFKQLFASQVERCWTLFEGNTRVPLEDRHPLGKQGIFDCAEIIYDFSGGQSVTMAELLATLIGPNMCGNPRNVPVWDPNTQDVNLYSDHWMISPDEPMANPGESIIWCAPKELMEDYWSYVTYTDDFFETVDDVNYIYYPKEITIVGSSVETAECELEDNEYDPIQLGGYVSSSGLTYTTAMCSFQQIYGGSGTDENDETAVISGKGRITISYFDYFDWGLFPNIERASDDYEACGNADVFNNFKDIGSNWYSEKFSTRTSDSILICYEQFPED